MDKSSASYFTTMDNDAITPNRATSLRSPDGSYYFPSLNRSSTCADPPCCPGHHHRHYETCLPHRSQQEPQAANLPRHHLGTNETMLLRHPDELAQAASLPTSFPRHQLRVNETPRHSRHLVETRLPHSGTNNNQMGHCQQLPIETHLPRLTQEVNETHMTVRLPSTLETGGICSQRNMAEPNLTSHKQDTIDTSSLPANHMTGNHLDDKDHEQELLNEEVSLMHKLCHSSLQDSEHDLLEITQADGKSLYSIKQFDDLNL